MDFHGNKLLFCKTKEEFDNLTLEQMEGYDTAFCPSVVTIDSYNTCNSLRINFLYKNKDLSNASLCLNACFSFIKKFHINDLIGAYGYFGTIEERNFAVSNNKIKIKNRWCNIIISLPHATLYDVGNQHWVCKKGNIHNIPKDKSVNIHEYYDVVEKEGYVECTVDFFERGVGKTQACGSGAFCVGMHLFKIYGKEVVVKTENGDKYFVNQNTISVEI